MMSMSPATADGSNSLLRQGYDIIKNMNIVTAPLLIACMMIGAISESLHSLASEKLIAKQVSSGIATKP